jgi:hypothetical protein
VTVTDRGRAVKRSCRLSPPALEWAHAAAQRAGEVDWRQAARLEDEDSLQGNADVSHGYRGSAVTVYLDTSSLVKLYVDEPDADDVQRIVGEADVVATSILAYAEARAAFARKRREKLMTPAEGRAAIRQLDLDWPQFFVILFGDELGHAADGWPRARHSGLRRHTRGLREPPAVRRRTCGSRAPTIACPRGAPLGVQVPVLNSTAGRNKLQYFRVRRALLRRTPSSSSAS